MARVWVGLPRGTCGQRKATTSCFALGDLQSPLYEGASGGLPITAFAVPLTEPISGYQVLYACGNGFCVTTPCGLAKWAGSRRFGSFVSTLSALKLALIPGLSVDIHMRFSHFSCPFFVGRMRAAGRSLISPASSAASSREQQC